jgi:hypothetical protein
MKIKQLLITIAFTILSSNVYAGLFEPVEVIVDLDTRSAQGDMQTARNSDSDFTMIGCGIRKIAISPTEAISFGFCQANSGETEEGSFTCFTQNPDVLAGIYAISDFSFITFGWDENDECTRIGNSTQSFYLPNVKGKK